MALLILNEPHDHHDYYGINSLVQDILTPWSRRPLIKKLKSHQRPHQLRRRAPFTPGTEVSQSKDQFKVCMDVQQFSPDEITVKTVDGHVVVEGKHEETEDDHGSVYRHFVRRYPIPEGYRPDDVVSTLSSDGVLSISAPKYTKERPGERIVPILTTGPVHRDLQNKPETPQEESKEDPGEKQKSAPNKRIRKCKY